MRQGFRITAAVFFAEIFFLYLAYYTSDQTSGYALGRMPWRRQGVLKWRQLKNYALSLVSPCLSSSLVDVLYKLYTR